MFEIADRVLEREKAKEEYKIYCKLWAAVFEQVVIDIKKGNKAKKFLIEKKINHERKKCYLRRKKIAEEALEWVKDRNGTFDDVCIVLGLHPDSARNMVLDMVN